MTIIERIGWIALAIIAGPVVNEVVYQILNSPQSGVSVTRALIPAIAASLVSGYCLFRGIGILKGKQQNAAKMRVSDLQRSHSPSVSSTTVTSHKTPKAIAPNHGLKAVKDSPFFPDHSRWKDLFFYGRIGLALSGLGLVLSLLFAWQNVRSTFADGKDFGWYLALVFSPLLITLPVGIFVITTNKIVNWSDVRQPLGLTRELRKDLGHVLFGLLGIIWVIGLLVQLVKRVIQ